MTNDRRPNWGKWRHIPEAKIWELVALSLDIDPDKVRHSSHGWMAGEHMFEEETEFKDRLEIVIANASHRAELARTVLSMSEPSHCKMRVTGFARFAHSVGWVLPKEFPSALNKDEWLSRDAWSEAELRDLLSGLEPNASRISAEETNSSHEAIRRAVLMGALKSREMSDATKGDKFYAHNRFFAPAEATQWATAIRGRFPKFPFSPQDFDRSPVTPVTEYLCERVIVDFSTYLKREAESRRKRSDPGSDALLIAHSVLQQLLAKSLGSAADRSHEQSPETGLKPRKEATYLNIVGALLETISRGIPNQGGAGSTLGPVTGFESEAKLIAAIAKHYQGFGGLSPSNLQRKFAEAKRSLSDA